MQRGGEIYSRQARQRGAASMRGLKNFTAILGPSGPTKVGRTRHVDGSVRRGDAATCARPRPRGGRDT